jgi:hypothetical protein
VRTFGAVTFPYKTDAGGSAAQFNRNVSAMPSHPLEDPSACAFGQGGYIASGSAQRRMFVKLRYLFLLTLALWSFQVDAQPLFRYEHDWTVMIGGRMCGIREVVQTPGEFRSTRIWVAGHLLEMRSSAQHIGLVLTVFSASLAAICYLSRRSKRQR